MTFIVLRTVQVFRRMYCNQNLYDVSCLTGVCVHILIFINIDVNQLGVVVFFSIRRYPNGGVWARKADMTKKCV